MRQLARAARDAAGRCYGAAAAVSPFSRKKAPAVFTVGAFSPVSEINGAVKDLEVIRLKDDPAVLLHVERHIRPVGVQVAVLLDENVVENIVGHAVLAGLHDGGIGQGLMVGHVQALVLEMEAVAHPAAIESLIGELLFEVLQNFVVLLLIEVLGRGLGVVVTELDGNIVLPPALDILRELVCGIVLVEHAVDALGRGDSGHDLVGRFLDVALQMARNVDAGDLVRVAAGEVDHLLRAAAGLHGERGVDIHLVRPGIVEHPLQVAQLGEGAHRR